MQMPAAAFNAVRKQYEALQVMRAIMGKQLQLMRHRVLGIMKEDISIL